MLANVSKHRSFCSLQGQKCKQNIRLLLILSQQSPVNPKVQKRSQNITFWLPFGTLERTRTSGLPLRRRSRYPLRYQGLYTIFNFFAIFGGCSCSRLGGGPSILVRYGGIYRNYSVIQGSGIRTVRLLGGGRSILLSYRRI